MRIAVFGYGSLVDPRSASETLGRPVHEVWPARLNGWRRRFSTARDNLSSEKTFARVHDGWLPPVVLALNLEPDTTAPDPTAPVDPSAPADSPNGALVEVEAAELDRLDRRELRYDRIDVTDDVRCEVGDVGRVFTYTARPERLSVRPPKDAVVLASYLAAVEAAFESLGRRELQTYRATTGPPPVEVVEARLVRGEIRPGNPRAW